MMTRIALVSALLTGIVAAGCGPTMPTRVGPAVPRSAPALPFTHPTGIRFVVLPVGKVETVKHILEMRRPLLMSAHEVTNTQYEKFAAAHKRAASSPGDADPAANVTWKEAADFCTWLTKNDPLGRQYKIPDPVEWEYAARGGSGEFIYPWGNEIDPAKACYAAKAAKPVGSYPPNKFGLYDMAGNAAEWVFTDDVPPYELRGGSWCDEAAGLQVTKRGKMPEKDEVLDHHGFRVLCEPPLLH